jgi:3-deoxy-D-manno-octulosonate 8-phosphate phosphatase (KDO 8-P phosphatase)
MSYSSFDDLPTDIRERASRVRLAVFDVDGVLTDGSLCFADDGREWKTFHVHDGFGLQRLRANGIEVAWISGRLSHIVTTRAHELGLAHVYQGQEDKLQCFLQLAHALKLDPVQCAYCGDDLPDLPVMRRVGLAVAVANAHPWVRERAHWRTQHPGGAGGVREVCDLLLAAQGKAAAELARFV